MSRFADPRATRTVDLGACECPGAPHNRDEATIRGEYSGSDIALIAGASGEDEAEAAEAIAPFILGWNLLGPNGEPWPPGPDSLRALKQGTLTAIVDGISEGISESSGLPNASGAPSVESPRESASPTPTPILTPTT